MDLWERLTQEVRRLGWSKAETARRAGVDIEQFYSWCRRPERGRRSIQPRADSGLDRVAKVLGVSESYLRYGEQPSHKNDTHGAGLFQLPLIRLENLSALLPDQDVIDVWTGGERVPLPKSLLEEGGIELGPNAFATVLEDNSLEPEAFKGDYLICEPDRQPEPGEMCVSIVDSEAIVRFFARASSPDGPIGRLKPINPHYDERLLDGKNDRTLAACLWRISPIRRL